MLSIHSKIAEGFSDNDKTTTDSNNIIFNANIVRRHNMQTIQYTVKINVMFCFGNIGVVLNQSFYCRKIEINISFLKHISVYSLIF